MKRLRLAALAVTLLASAPVMAQNTAPSPNRGPEGTGNYVAGKPEGNGNYVAGKPEGNGNYVAGKPEGNGNYVAGKPEGNGNFVAGKPGAANSATGTPAK